MSYLSIPILAIAAILQASLLPFLTAGAGTPDFVFLLVLAWSINGTLRQNVIWAIVGGLLLDLLSIMPLGTTSLALIVIVALVSGLGERVYRVGPAWLLGLTLAGTLFLQGYKLVIIYIYRTIGFLPSDTGGLPDLLGEINTVVIPTMIYNLIAIGFVYFIIRRLQRRLMSSNP